MLDLKLISRAQRLLQMIMKDQPGVICIDADYVQLKIGTFLEIFKSCMVRIGADESLHLEAYRDGVSYVTVVLVGNPEYVELKEKALAGQPCPAFLSGSRPKKWTDEEEAYPMGLTAEIEFCGNKKSACGEDTPRGTQTKSAIIE